MKVAAGTDTAGATQVAAPPLAAAGSEGAVYAILLALGFSHC